MGQGRPHPGHGNWSCPPGAQPQWPLISNIGDSTCLSQDSASEDSTQPSGVRDVAAATCSWLQPGDRGRGEEEWGVGVWRQLFFNCLCYLTVLFQACLFKNKWVVE